MGLYNLAPGSQAPPTLGPCGAQLIASPGNTLIIGVVVGVGGFLGIVGILAVVVVVFKRQRSKKEVLDNVVISPYMHVPLDILRGTDHCEFCKCLAKYFSCTNWF
jgi:hypothetical protein